MGTFLVTPRMNPELRARVERAVSGKARARHHAAALGMKSPFAGSEGFRPAKLVPLAVLLLIGGLAAAMVIYEKRALEEDRTALLSELSALHAELPPGHENLLAEIDQQLLDAVAAADAPELVDPALRSLEALDATLRRPTLYVHAIASDLRDARGIDDAARGSDKDPFLLCLLKPPPSNSEKDLIGRVRGVYFAGAKVDDETASVRRLAEARLGLAAVAPAFEASVRGAQDRSAIKRLRKEMQKAPLDLAKKGAAAELLLIVADSASGSRVTIVDIAAKKHLLRVRRRAEEMTYSSKGAMHREEIDACTTAMAVRRAVTE